MLARTPTRPLLIGLIADTHGLIRPQALGALRGADLIVHAGDIGHAAVLDALTLIAPLHAVKGNIDRSPWANQLADTMIITVGELKLYLIHDINELPFEPSQRGIAVVISGHSHKPSIVRRDGVLFVNPGSAGPRRFNLPVALAKLHVNGFDAKAEIVELKI